TTGSNGVTRSWDVATGKPTRTPVDGKAKTKVLSFSPDSKTTISRGIDGMAILCDAATGKPYHGIQGQLAGIEIETAAFSADGKTAVVGGIDGAVRLWDVATGKLIRTLAKHDLRIDQMGRQSAYLASMAFSPDGKMVVAGAARSKVFLWEVATG